MGYVADARGNVKKGIKILKVSKDVNSAAYSPLNKASVDSGDYPIARGLFQSTAGAPKGAVLDFVMFELSTEGQKIVEREGFFPIGSRDQEENRKKLEK